MAQIIQLGLQVDSTPIVALKRKLDEVKVSLQSASDPAEIQNLIKEVKSLTSAYDTLNDSLEDTGKAATYAAGSIGELEAKQAALNEEFKNVAIGSEAYNQLQQQLIQTNTQLRNIELSNEALDNEQLAGELKSVAGGFSDVAGGLTLIGVSSGSVEQIAQTFAKVEGATKAVTGGIEAYSSGMKVINALTARGATLNSVMAAITGTKAAAEVTDAAALGAQTTATGAATTATYALNAAMLLNPVFLLIAGLAGLVGALAYFASSAETAEDLNNKLNISIEKYADLLDRANEKSIRNSQNKLDLARAEGKSDEELLKLELNVLAEEEKARVKNRDFEKKQLELKTIAKKIAIIEGNEDLVKSIGEEIKATRDKYKDLKALDGQYEIDKKILKASAKTKTDADQKAQDEKDDAEQDRKNQEAIANNKRANEERKKKQEEYAKNRFDALRTQQDLELSLMEDGKKKDIASNKLKYERLLEDTISNERLTGEAIKDANGKIVGYTGEKGERIKALETQNKIEVQKITDKYDKDAIKKQEEVQKLIDGLLKEDSNNKRVILNKNYDDQLKDLDKKLKDDVYTIEEYNKIKDALLEKNKKDNEELTKEYNLRDQKAQLDMQDDSLQKTLDLLELEKQAELDNADLTEKEKLAIEAKYNKLSYDATMKSIEDKSAAFNKYADTVSAVFNTLINDENKVMGAATKGLLDLTNALTDTVSKINQLKDIDFATIGEKVKAISETVAAGVAAIAQIATAFIDVVRENNQQKEEEELFALEETSTKEKNILTERYNNGLISKEQYDKSIGELDKKLESQQLAVRKKAFEQDKKLKIATAIIGGITGAVSAFAGAMQLGPIAGPIVGGVLAAAVGALTAVNVSKIKATQFESPTAATAATGGAGANIDSASSKMNLFGNSTNFNNASGQQSAEANTPPTQNINVTVGVDEITSTQQNVQQIKESGTL